MALALVLALCLGGCGVTVTELSSKSAFVMIPVRCKGACRASADVDDLEAVGELPTKVTLRWRIVRERVRENDNIGFGVVTILQSVLGSLAMYAMRRFASPSGEGVSTKDKWIIGTHALLFAAASVVSFATAWSTRTRTMPSKHTVGVRVHGRSERHTLEHSVGASPERLSALTEIVFDSASGRFTLRGKAGGLKVRQSKVSPTAAPKRRPTPRPTQPGRRVEHLK